ncbi:hypothetical protein [Elioraea thermophila]|uniref:hypothetical protein n=1 Tax=Elioraea thermophila TaxID=2185104 RepID=UPI001300A852|nr:hypothetical protein [Elioraea thermophila]
MKAPRPSPARAAPASPLVVSDRLITLAQSASAHGRREAALVLLAAAHAVLEAPKRTAAGRSRRPAS